MATRIVSGIDKDSVATPAAAMTASTRNRVLQQSSARTVRRRDSLDQIHKVCKGRV
jgi:hypothetical protein